MFKCCFQPKQKTTEQPQIPVPVGLENSEKDTHGNESQNDPALEQRKFEQERAKKLKEEYLEKIRKEKTESSKFGNDKVEFVPRRSPKEIADLKAISTLVAYKIQYPSEATRIASDHKGRAIVAKNSAIEVKRQMQEEKQTLKKETKEADPAEIMKEQHRLEEAKKKARLLKEQKRREVRQASEELDSRLASAKNFIEKGLSYERESLYHKAIDQYDRALRMWLYARGEQGREDRQVAELHYKISNCQQAMGLAGPALEEAKLALALFSKVEPYGADTNACRGVVYRLHYHLQQAK